MYTDRDKNSINNYTTTISFSIFEEKIKDYFKAAMSEMIDEIKKVKEQDSHEPLLLTINDIAKKFKVTKATVHNWMNKGSITGQKFGKNRYFTEDEVKKSMAKYGFSKQWDNRD